MARKNKNAAYTALQASGASLPEQRNLANLAGAIEEADSIFSGYRNGWGAVVLAMVEARQFTDEAVNGIIRIASQSEFEQLSTSSTDVVRYSGVRINPVNIVGVILGENATTIGDNFCYRSSRLSFLDNQQVVTSIGSRFLAYNSYFCGELNFPHLRSIGDEFLVGLYFGAPPIHIAASVESIGQAFIRQSGVFTGPLVVDSPFPPTDDSSLTNTSSTTSGQLPNKTIKLSGPAAQIWKAALPDISTGLYKRHLEVVS